MLQDDNAVKVAYHHQGSIRCLRTVQQVVLNATVMRRTKAIRTWKTKYLRITPKSI